MRLSGNCGAAAAGQGLHDGFQRLQTPGELPAPTAADAHSQLSAMTERHVAGLPAQVLLPLRVPDEDEQVQQPAMQGEFPLLLSRSVTLPCACTAGAIDRGGVHEAAGHGRAALHAHAAVAGCGGAAAAARARGAACAHAPERAPPSGDFEHLFPLSIPPGGCTSPGGIRNTTNSFAGYATAGGVTLPAH